MLKKVCQETVNSSTIKKSNMYSGTISISAPLLAENAKSFTHNENAKAAKFVFNNEKYKKSRTRNSGRKKQRHEKHNESEALLI